MKLKAGESFQPGTCVFNIELNSFAITAQPEPLNATLYV